MALNMSLNMALNMTGGEKTAIVMLIYYNYDLVERTLESFSGKFSGDIIFVENPSVHSHEMRMIAKKYNVKYHYVCNQNIGGCAFELFFRHHRLLLENYDFIAATESDVVIGDGAIQETIDILKNNSEVKISSIQLDVGLHKYRNLPLDQWIPRPVPYKDFFVGCTGFQFIMFPRPVLYQFLKELSEKKHVNPIALGCSDFYGLSDTNLNSFVEKNHMLWGITTRKCDHIGWEKYLDDDQNYCESTDYCKTREKHLYFTRSNEVLDKMNEFDFAVL